MEITKVYPLDAVFDNPDDVPEDVMNYIVFTTYEEMFNYFHDKIFFFLSSSADKSKQALRRIL